MQSSNSLYHSSPSFGWSERAVPPAFVHALVIPLAHAHAHAVALAGHDLLHNAGEAATATELGRGATRADGQLSLRPTTYRETRDSDDDVDDDDDDGDYDHGGGGGSEGGV